MPEIGNLWVRIGAKIDEFEQGLRNVESSIKEAEKRFEGFRNVGKRLEDVGKTLTVGISLPLIGVGAAAIKMSTDFNAAMANVATLIPGNTERVNELKKAVQDMAVSVGKSTGDLAGGLYQVISAFGDTADTVKILEINAKAAAAGLATTTDAINLTSAVTKGYGDTTAQAVQKVSDLVFQAVKLGQTTFPELASSIGRVTPLAASLGVSMEELFGVMATGTGVTGTAAEVSTQLRGVLQSLMSPTEAMSELLNKLGYESGQAMIQQLGLKGTIDTIVKAAQDAGVPLQEYISSIEGQTLALALAGPQADAFTEKLAAMKDAAGATDQAFREQTEGVNKVGFAWAQAKSQIEVTAQNLGDALAPALLKATEAAQPLIDRVQQLSNWFANLDPRLQTVIIGIAGFAIAAGPALVVIGQLLQVLPLLSLAFAALTGPIGLVIAVIAGAIAIGVLLYTRWDEIKTWLGNTWNSIKNKAVKVWGAISGFLAEKWETIKNWASEKWGGIQNTITSSTQSAAGWLGQKWNEVQASLGNIWEKIKTLAGEKWEGVKSIIKGVINGIINFINRFIRYWNNIEISVPQIEVPFVGSFGGWTIRVPQIPEIPTLATGGIVTRPTLALLGETGPEAVLPLRDTGATGIVIHNINIYGNSADEIWEKFNRELARRGVRL